MRESRPTEDWSSWTGFITRFVVRMLRCNFLSCRSSSVRNSSS
jgi:hypothetical protein